MSLAAATASSLAGENPRGIPKADFIEDIPGLIARENMTATELIEQADTQYNKVRVQYIPFCVWFFFFMCFNKRMPCMF